MKLVYLPRMGIACPGDGWPAADHEEPDEPLARQKVASGYYRGPDSKEQREAAHERAEAKKHANEKEQQRITDEIAVADEAITQASENAAETRRRLGREGTPTGGKK